MPDTHLCAAEACTKRIPMSMLMCRADWGLVPQPIKDRVWHAYREQPGSAGHRRAKDDAIAAVREAKRPLIQPPPRVKQGELL